MGRAAGINADEVPLLGAKPKFKSPRVEVLDILRGFIMVVMAVDHVSLFVAHVHGSEEWYGETQYSDTSIDHLKFATRFATHMCAPGFSYLMGIGMVFFTFSRIRLGWSLGRIFRHHALRAFLLLVPCAVIEINAFRLPSYVFPELETSSGVYIFTTVLFSLSTSMFICGALLVSAQAAVRHTESQRVLPLLLAFWAAMSFVISELIVTHSDKDDPHWGVLLLAVPGVQGILGVTYCVFPWCGVCALGCLMGLFLLRRPEKLRLAATVIMFVTFTLFVILRFARSFGNLVNIPDDPSVLDFLDVVKYPPALTYVLITFAILHMLIALFITLSRLEEQPFASIFWKPLKVYGTSPLFYYIMHLVMGALVALIVDSQKIEGLAFGYIYPIWIGIVVLLYPMCQWYGRFKSSTPPESVWRFF